MAKNVKRALDPDEILLDASNLPGFNAQQFEGRIERPISKTTFYLFGFACVLVVLVFFVKTIDLQVRQGAALAARSSNNMLREHPIFAERGIVTDRLGVELAWNEPELGRRYKSNPGFAHILGYISYPTPNELDTKERYQEEWIGRDGVERAFDERLHGRSGIKIEETDVLGEVMSRHVLREPEGGKDLRLSIDARLQQKLHELMATMVAEGRFLAGAGVLIDVSTGELITLTSVPEYDPNILSAGRDREKINNYLSDEKHPFLNRAVSGLYTPGSTIKPLIAIAALNEGVISPEKQILSTGKLVVPNPFFPDQPSVFKDWKAHGWVDLRRALAVSSNVYFYQVGGGFDGQLGVGINKIKDYATRFGFGLSTGLKFLDEGVGVVPTPEWKARVFDGDDWRLGDTYHTAIGQYGWQVTPLQLVRAVAAIANDGYLVTPTVLAVEADQPPRSEISGLRDNVLQIVREGMRQAVLEGTSGGLNLPNIEVAAKTGTAELGSSKSQVNSLVTGFFPYQSPRYAFAVVMERGSSSNLIGATYVMRQFLDWMTINTPEYFTGS